MLFARKNPEMVAPAESLPGRDMPATVTNKHFVLGAPIQPPFPADCEQVLFALGCFWGAERVFWNQDGVFTTAVGYAGGFTPNPLYEEVCSGRTGHTEGVLVVYYPARVSFDTLLKLFWEGHDPTQGMRQGNDIGTQYRSGVYTNSKSQQDAAEASRTAYQQMLTQADFGEITTEIRAATDFYYAEDYHQQYLAKDPNGYCGLGGTGVACPIGLVWKPPTVSD